MNTTERNWSAIEDYQGGCFGQRSFYTRQEWIEQCFEWTFGGMPSVEEMDEDERDYYDYLCKGTDESLMHYIEDMWEIRIRETTWLKEGNECLWHTGFAGHKVKIIDIPMDDVLQDNTGIRIEHNGVQEEVIMDELYGLTSKTCPKCGHPLYVSDLCSYPYVCLECDENF
jgi:hypothetical protein